MGRVVHTQKVGQRRRKLLQWLALALREMVTQTSASQTLRDLAAFLVLVLEEVEDTVEQTVTAWEKRGYWVKADRFRQEWAWVSSLRAALAQALQAEDWDEVTRLALALYPHLSQVKLPKRQPSPPPWQGAWARWLERSRNA